MDVVMLTPDTFEQVAERTGASLETITNTFNEYYVKNLVLFYIFEDDHYEINMRSVMDVLRAEQFVKCVAAFEQHFDEHLKAPTEVKCFYCGSQKPQQFVACVKCGVMPTYNLEAAMRNGNDRFGR